MTQWETRFKEAFLCCDKRKSGSLQGPECADIYQSLGLVLTRQMRDSVPAMTMEEFIKYGMKLLEELPGDRGLEKLFEAIQNPKSKTVGIAELREVMGLMKNRTPEELDILMSTLDPHGTGKFSYQSFVDVFSK